MKKLICIIAVFALLNISSNASAIETSATAAVIINGDTGEVIYSCNSEQRLSMASTTKIMTALLLCENGQFEKEVTVTAEMLKVEGSSMGLLAGDKVTYHDLLYGMLLASGNDAANVTAISIGGTVEGFAEMMNCKAAELGLVNTHFVTPSGLDADGHYTTALELAKLARYAMQNEHFALAASSKSVTLNYGNPPYRRTLTNHNKLLKTFDGAVGVKTGFTKKSGRCLVSAAKRDGKYIIAVTLNDPNDWKDHTEMLEYGFSEIRQTRYRPNIGSYVIPVVGSELDEIMIDILPFTVNTLETADISCTVNLPKFLYAPLKADEVIGSVVYKMGDNVLGKVDLFAGRDVSALAKKPSAITELIENIKYILINI